MDGSAGIITTFAIKRRDSTAKGPLDGHVVAGQVEIAAVDVSPVYLMKRAPGETYLR